MPSAINCPSCKRVLNLPAEALNRVVQCPACKHQFHPAEAAPADNVRPALPKLDSSAGRSEPAAAPVSTPAEPSARPPERRAAPPLPPASFDVRRSDRRGKREVEDMCPACQAFVPRGVNKCPECGAEFVPDEDEHYRPWEQEGMERRDSESHRGSMLLIMGISSLILPSFFFVCYLGILTSLLGLVLGAAAAWMGRNDLRKMDQHVMNRDGQSMTNGGVICGLIGLALSVLGLIASIALTAMTF